MKLCTWKHYTLFVITCIIGTSIILLIRYLDQGRLANIEIISAVIAFITGMILLTALCWYANRK
jgi:hypothetical protein